jgi:homoserine dehydrogenase
MTTFDLVLVGFGNVARRFVSLLEERRAMLERDHELAVRIIGIVTKRHGRMFSLAGVDAIDAASGLENGARLNQSMSSATASDDGSSVDFVQRVVNAARDRASRGELVVVETTTLDIEHGQPAIDHVRAALSGGAHVITANKGPAAFAHRTLTQMAADADRRFLFEGAVMDGIPVFNLVRETLPAVTISAFRGIVNTTTNYILTAMERGSSFDDALADMQSQGIAEADPSLDVDGWDAAAKTAILANVLLGASITPHHVEREGIGPTTAARATAARAAGSRLKLVARGERHGSGIDARVGLEELAGEDLLAGIEGKQNAIVLATDVLDEIAVVQRGGSLTHTAYALVTDLVTIAGDVKNCRATSESLASTPARRIR